MLAGPGANGGYQGIVETTTANIPRIKRTPQLRRRALAQPLPVMTPMNPKIANNPADRFSTNHKPGSSCLVLSWSTYEIPHGNSLVQIRGCDSGV